MEYRLPYGDYDIELDVRLQARVEHTEREINRVHNGWWEKISAFSGQMSTLKELETEATQLAHDVHREVSVSQQTLAELEYLIALPTARRCLIGRHALFSIMPVDCNSLSGTMVLDTTVVKDMY